jgi:hypothetical protein
MSPMPLVPLLALLAHVAAAVHITGRLPAPELELPLQGASTVLPTPHFSWRPSCDPKAVMPVAAGGLLSHCGGYVVQISRVDSGAGGLVVDERVASVLTRFVPVAPLQAGQYRWRVAPLDVDGELPELPAWSPLRSLSVVPPQRVIAVSASASYSDMQRAFAEAAASPVAVPFASHPRWCGRWIRLATALAKPRAACLRPW